MSRLKKREGGFPSLSYLVGMLISFQTTQKASEALPDISTKIYGAGPTRKTDRLQE